MKSKKVLLVFVISVLFCSCSSKYGLYSSKNIHKPHYMTTLNVDSNGLVK